MESIRDNEGDDAVQRYYWELGRRIHHDRDFMNFELSDVLKSINVSADHYVAFENPETLFRHILLQQQYYSSALSSS